MIVIMDASCTRSFNHNASYMHAYAKAAHEINPGLPIECWIGEAADSQVKESFSFPVYPILRSPIYSFQKSNWLLYYRDRLLNKLLYFLYGFENNYFVVSYFRETIFRFYAAPAVQRAQELAKHSHEISFILPSADGLTIRLAKKLVELGFPIKCLIIRTITAESRGVYGIKDLLQFINDLQKDYPHIEIKIGWESKVVLQELGEQGFTKNLLHWAPMPASQSSEEKFLQAPVRIGFLGVARRNKGFDLIPKIIEQLMKTDISIKYVIQLSADPWVGYEDTLKSILNMNVDTKLLNSRMTHDKLLYEISQVDLLIMPYSTEQYRRTGSGILYQGADFLVPSVTFKGLGFSWDIENFEIGATFENLNQLGSKINLDNVERWKQNCVLYNKFRNQAVNSLLSLSSN